MNPWKRATLILTLILLVFIVLRVGIFYYENVFAEKEDIYSRNEPISQTFAQCLSSENIKMYGAYWCPHCKNQIEMFGDDWKFFNGYVECEDEKELCSSKGITGYPTWEIGDEFFSGEQSLKTLSKLTGCQLN